MKIEVENTIARVVSASDEELRWTRDYLTFEDSGNAFRARKGKRAKRVKPPRVPLYDILSDTFPAGLLRLVVTRAREAGHTVEVKDVRPPGLAADPNADLAWLRDYQKKAVDVVLQRERGILWMPTGSGKTDIACGIVRALPGPWLFLVHRGGLMHQAADRYDLRNKEHGHTKAAPAARFGDGRYEVGPELTVATFQTLRARQRTAEGKKLLTLARGLIVDEAHVLPAGTFYAMAMAAINARHRIGLSGTPLDRDDQRSLMAVGALGPVVHKLDALELIRKGVLAMPEVTMVEVYQKPSQAVTYKGIYGDLIVRSTVRNKLLTRIAGLASKPALLFVKELKHGKELVKRIENFGLNVAFVWGNTPEKKRAEARKRLVRGDLDVIVASVVWQEGVDIPELKAVIVGCAGKSAIAALQRAGRGMRPDGDSTTFELWDIDDQGSPMMERHSRARRKAYEREGYNVTTGDLDQLLLSTAIKVAS